MMTLGLREYHILENTCNFVSRNWKLRNLLEEFYPWGFMENKVTKPPIPK